MKSRITMVFTGLLFAGLMFASCKKCKDCSGKLTQYWDDSVVAVSTVSPQEVCGDDLKTLEANPTVTQESTFFGMTQKYVTEYECQ